MLDLRPDGTIGIDFTQPDGTTKTVVVNPPKVGGYRRLRKQHFDHGGREERMIAQMPEGTSQLDTSNQVVVMREESALAWWKLVLLGDETFKPLTDDEVPTDEESWPLELVSLGSGTIALNQWMSTPLVQSPTSAPQTSEPPQPPDPS